MSEGKVGKSEKESETIPVTGDAVNEEDPVAQELREYQELWRNPTQPRKFTFSAVEAEFMKEDIPIWAKYFQEEIEEMKRVHKRNLSQFRSDVYVTSKLHNDMLESMRNRLKESDQAVHDLQVHTTQQEVYISKLEDLLETTYAKTEEIYGKLQMFEQSNAGTCKELALLRADVNTLKNTKPRFLSLFQPVPTSHNIAENTSHINNQSKNVVNSFFVANQKGEIVQSGLKSTESIYDTHNVKYRGRSYNTIGPNRTFSVNQTGGDSTELDRTILKKAIDLTHKITPFIGVNDSRTPPMFIEEFDIKFGTLPEDQATQVFLNLLDRKQLPWVNSLPHYLTLNDVKTRLMEECWNFEVQVSEVQFFRDAVFDRKKDTTVSFAIHWYNRMKDCMHVPTGALLPRILSKLPVEAEREIPRKDQDNYELIISYLNRYETDQKLKSRNKVNNNFSQSQSNFRSGNANAGSQSPKFNRFNNGNRFSNSTSNNSKESDKTKENQKGDSKTPPVN